MSCGGPKEEVVETRQPVYCIREVVFLDNNPQGRVLLDLLVILMDRRDKYQEIDRQTYNELDVPVCQSDDPRMSLGTSAWADGRDIIG